MTFSDYPAGSILSEMKLDICASQDTGDINMFYEGVFYKNLTGFEFYKKTSNFIFVFDGELKVPLGAPIVPSLAKYMVKANRVAAFQVTLEGKAGDAQFVPLKVL